MALGQSKSAGRGGNYSKRKTRSVALNLEMAHVERVLDEQRKAWRGITRPIN